MTTTRVSKRDDDDRPDERPIALYGRVSTQAQADSGLSIEMQVAELPELAERVWPDAPHMLIDLDAGRSAWRGSKKRGQGRERAGTQELWQLVRDRAIRGIAVENPSRLFRDDAAALAFVDDCAAAGVEIHTLKHGRLDTRGAGRVLTGVLFTLAAVESDDKSEKVLATKKKNAEAGYWNGGTEPHGTRAVKQGRYLVLEATEGIELVRQVFALMDSGLSQTETAKRLGVDRVWLTKRVLRNRHYVGQVRHGQTWHKAQWPAFMDVAQFERVQQTLERNGHECFRNAASQPFGVALRCGYCDKLLRGSNNSAGYHYYACRGDKEEAGCGRRYPAETVEGTVCLHLGESARVLVRALDADLWHGFWTARDGTGKLGAYVADLEAAAANLIRLAAKGGPVGAEAEAQLDALNVELADKQRDLADLSRSRESREADLRRLVDALGPFTDGALGGIVGFWQTTDVAEKRAAFAAIFERIAVFEDRIEYVYKYGLPMTPQAFGWTPLRRNHPESPTPLWLAFGFGRPRPGQDWIAAHWREHGWNASDSDLADRLRFVQKHRRRLLAATGHSHQSVSAHMKQGARAASAAASASCQAGVPMRAA